MIVNQIEEQNGRPLSKIKGGGSRDFASFRARGKFARSDNFILNPSIAKAARDSRYIRKGEFSLISYQQQQTRKRRQ